ncbi:MAG: 30S ribosomal protein S6 [Candidatus Dadabacteria bacterium]|nr:30S ribosomal protein S6 [Candidatus Dadabacteria bacterium]
MAVTPNYYETLYITRPDIQEEDLAKIQQKLQDSISAHQGEIIKADKWAERGLAYEIQNYKKGIYYILIFKALPGVGAEIEKHLSFYNTDILRFITLRITEEAAKKVETEPETQTADSVEEPTVEITEEVKITEDKEETPQDKAETEPETQTADSVEAPATDTTEEEGGTQ